MEAKMHVWYLEEPEYARHERRRGRRFAYTSLVPERTALIVVDMVPFFVAGSPYCMGILPNIDRLATVVRDAGGTVAWVMPGVVARSDVGDEFFGPERSALYRNSGGTGPLEARIWPDLTVHDGDLLVEKGAASAFFPGRCDLPQRLAERNIDTVVITGTLTNVCCESSARDASTLGLRVIMVADANAARRDQDHNATLHTVYRTFGDVRTTDDVVALVKGAAG
ncbi:isochorismatase family cysteine hydrolase [Saccharothrix violaceirubra]|uniref:Nicotinamidase-related amidase n=1 Tax=Saccharothrix violaceirubra TaxID=413306 RepID=A0A7W7T266_9PSEU|nr:isochorismatase family cysteine hydrolase [Saccharothrix violaceirubra]MBB4965158.1 nicotinamidase-related amidase [Saccharothrix violaceirubra]